MPNDAEPGKGSQNSRPCRPYLPVIHSLRQVGQTINLDEDDLDVGELGGKKGKDLAVKGEVSKSSCCILETEKPLKKQRLFF